MAPRIRNNQLETRTQRAKLAPRRKPYAAPVAPGIRLGYRRNHGAGTWSAICADGAGGSWLKRIALADDVEDADGKTVMTFWQAAEAAKKLARAGDARPATVREAVEGYQRDLAAREKNVVNATGLLRRLTPVLASKAVGLLTRQDLVAFRDGLIATGVKKSTVNRYMTPLNAALNLAATLDDRIGNAKAWKLGFLPDATHARNVILTDAQVAAIVAAAYEHSHEWGLLVETLAVTGTRISQAQKLRVEDLLPADRLDMPVSRKGRGKKALAKRPVPVTPELAAKLHAHAEGRRRQDALLVDAAGRPWCANCQCRRFPETVKAAGLDPVEVTTYALRHSSIVRQLLANVPIRVVASNHDTSVEMIEAHYSKYITDHSDALTRRALIRCGRSEGDGDTEMRPS